MKIKKSKISMRKETLSLAVLLVLALSSCTKEPLGLSMPSGDGIEVRMTFAQSVASKNITRADFNSLDENQLNRVTILVFNEDGKTLETVLSVDLTKANTTLDATQPKWKNDKILVVSPVINQLKPKIIYAIANWKTIIFDQKTYNETTLKAELITSNTVEDINTNPMIMSGSTLAPNLSKQFYSVTVNMARQLSKIVANVTLSKDTQAKMPNIEWQVERTTITVVNIPNKSYIIDKNNSPTNFSLLTSAAITMDNTSLSAGNNDLKWSKSVYINENPVLGILPTNSTYIIVQLPYKNRTTLITDHDNYYKLLIRTTDVTSPYKVLRNTIYNFNINVVGMGLPINNLKANVNVDDLLTVNSWEKGEVINTDNNNTPTNFTINRSQLKFKSTDTSLSSAIITDVPNWKLMKEDGTTMFSFIEGKIGAITVGALTYTLSGKASVATITVSKAVGSTTFPTQRMLIIAKNLQVPFTVIYQN